MCVCVCVCVCQTPSRRRHTRTFGCGCASSTAQALHLAPSVFFWFKKNHIHIIKYTRWDTHSTARRHFIQLRPFFVYLFVFQSLCFLMRGCASCTAKELHPPAPVFFSHTYETHNSYLPLIDEHVCHARVQRLCPMLHENLRVHAYVCVSVCVYCYTHKHTRHPKAPLGLGLGFRV